MLILCHSYFIITVISSVLQNLPMTLMFGIFETFYTENTSRIMSTIPTAVSWFSGFEHFSAHRGRVIFFCQTFENRFWWGIIALGIKFCVMNFPSIARWGTTSRARHNWMWFFFSAHLNFILKDWFETNVPY